MAVTKSFHTFMDTKSQEEEYKGKDRANMLVAFRGNRFNIIFYDAEIVFYLRKYFKEFFTDVHLPTNALQKAVNLDISEDVLLATSKALGLCSKLITAPFWRIMERVFPPRSKQYNQTLANFLSRVKLEPASFVCRLDRPFPSYVKEDDVLDHLLERD